MTKHLDLGCGTNPRNPFDADEVFGVDIRAPENGDGEHFKVANLTIQPIPFPDDYFDSVSAYDFLEHIPRVIIYNEKTRLPFVELMNEIYRVLKPSGELYALTPYFPKESSFIDPTHVNFITKKTHRYFVKPDLMADMYGFKGNFEALRVQPVNAARETNPQWGWFKKLRKSIKPILKRKKTALLGKQHLVWHFRKLV